MGNQIQRTGFLVCPTCWDIPNPQLRPKVLPPDPVPILNARTEPAFSGQPTPTVTVAALPAAGSVTAPQNYYIVSDSTVPYDVLNLKAVVVGGGDFTVPVVSDGTNWIIA